MFSVQNCLVREDYRLSAWVLCREYRDNGGRTCLGESSEEYRLIARHSLLNAKGKESLQTDSKSAETLKDLESALLSSLL